ncbi:MAG: ATP-binding protein [Bacteriovoracaceae bacterium]
MKNFERYYTTITQFAKNAVITQGSKQSAFEYLCREIAVTLEVSIVGIWLFNQDKTAIKSYCSYETDLDLFTSGLEIKKNQVPLYFDYLGMERILSVGNTFVDPVTSEFVESYMKPLNIHALIDAPIYFDGDMVGILCCEQKKSTREWTAYDKYFVISCADFIGRIIEADKRREYENELEIRIYNLENESKRKLQDLNEAKINLDLAMDGASLAKWDWDIPSGRVIFSDQWAARLGYEVNELEPTLSTFKSRIHPDDISIVFDALDKHLSGQTNQYEAKFRMIDRFGSSQWILDRGKVVQRDEVGNPIRATGINLDISNIIMLEENLKQSEEQLLTMIKSIPSPVAMIDENLKFITFSQQWQDDWSFLGKAEVGCFIGDIYPVFNRKREWAEHFRKVLLGNVLKSEEELIEFKDENQYAWIHWELRPWRKVNGDIGGILILIENITRRKEAEMKLTQSSKLSALGEMAGGIAHEINNPLSIIRGYVDLIQKGIQRGTSSPETLNSHIEKIGKTVERISKIVNGMRRFSRDSSKDSRILYSLNQLIDDTLDISQERIKNNGIFLNIEKFHDNPVVECKPIEMSQVLLNLLGNSIHAVQLHKQPWLKIVCSETNEFYEIRVIDSGEGLNKSIQRKLFQPFFTTKDIGVGTGLGLSISKAIVEDHHGKLFYDPSSKNTCFVIQFRK